MIFLSYSLNPQTPSYGNLNAFKIEKLNAIALGGTANDSIITTVVHMGTHLDVPYHFYENGQTIESYDADFFTFTKILFLDIKPINFVIKEELLEKLRTVQDIGYEILIVKTGSCNFREDEKYWSENYGFHPDIYDILVEQFDNIRVFGFDTLSVSSFQNRELGREAHKRFLNPDKPILLLEDMDLREVKSNHFSSLVVAPLRIEQCDGLPCTVMAELV
jgi:arylformamidase